MPRRPAPFNEWVGAVRECAELIRNGNTVRSTMRIHYSIMRHAKDVVHAIVDNPGYVITEEMHKTYLVNQAKKRYTRHERIHNNIRILSNEEMRRCKKKPSFVSEQRWRIHLEWRKRSEHYNSIPPEIFL